MTVRLLALGRPAVCILCGRPVPSGALAWWEGPSASAVCLECRPIESGAPPALARPTAPEEPESGAPDGFIGSR